MRLRVFAATAILTALSCAAAAAAVRADWALTFGAPTTTKPRVLKPFAMLVRIEAADENTDSYTVRLTLTPSAAALRVVSWSSNAGIGCTRAGRAVVCSQRSIGGEPPFNQLSAVFVLRATKARKYSVIAKMAIEGDTNTANDAVKRTFTVRPRKR